MSDNTTDDTMILLVDDDEAIRELFGDLLKQRGYAVVTAASAAQALTILSTFRFRLVITDHNMPGITGMHLIQEIRRNYPWTRTILMSADPHHLPQLAQLCGCDRYFAKGKEIQQVMEYVGELIDRTDTRRSSQDAIQF